MRRRTTLAGVLLGGLLLAACSEAPEAEQFELGGGRGGPGATEVGTPALVAQREAAGIETCPRVPERDPADDVLPADALDCLGGGPAVSLASLRGEPTVVNVWASWCGPCRDELPVLQQLHGSGDVRVIGVDVDDPDPAGALAVAAAAGVTYPSVADPDSEVFARSQPAVPQTFFVDADGEVVEQKLVAYESYDDLRADVETVLGVAP